MRQCPAHFSPDWCFRVNSRWISVDSTQLYLIYFARFEKKVNGLLKIVQNGLHNLNYNN